LLKLATVRREAPVTHPRKEQHLENVETVEETLEKGPASEQDAEEPGIVDDICVEELAIDGICGVY
jgi:mycofactocin precursor